MQYIDDQKQLGEALGQLLPPPEEEDSLDLLLRWSKFEQCPHPDYPESKIWPAKVGDDMEVVFVQAPTNQAVLMVLRQKVDQIPVVGSDGKQRTFDDGKPMVSNVYELLGYRPVAGGPEAAAQLQQSIRNAKDEVAARGIEGAEPEAVPSEPARKASDDIAGA